MKITNYNCLSVAKITRSIELIDKFALTDPKYDFLVLLNWFHTVAENYYDGYHVSLCIEESNVIKPEECVQDLTMTELRQGINYGVFDWSKFKGQERPVSLLQSISYTLSKYDLSKVETDEMIRLDYPICLRAQGSWNREEIGNRFVWLEQSGYGTYINTEYGETDSYYITHILVRKVEKIKTTDDLVEEEIARLEDTIQKCKEEVDYYFKAVALNGEKCQHRKWGACTINEWDADKRYARLQYGAEQTGLISLEVAVKNKVLNFEKQTIMDFFAEMDALQETTKQAQRRKERLISAKDFNTKWMILHGYEE